MKRVVIVLCALMGASFSEAKWCHQNITTFIEVTKVMTRTKLVQTTWFSTAPKVETYKEVGLTPKFKQKRVCCDGYIPQNDNQVCIPTCPDGCPVLAECVEPNICKCQPGYHLQDNLCLWGDCGNCENGQCTIDGICECNPKYVRIGDSCKPICRNKCTNGFCAAPDRCECNQGYEENPENSRCEPICTQKCGGNAHCSAPEVCSCKFGFFGNASDVCQPWCKSECKNGQCVGPNNCACHQGFAKVDGLCMPDCQSGCKFGDCLDEGVCQCWPDYVYNNSTGSCQETLDVEIATPAPQTHVTMVQGIKIIREYTRTSPAAFCLNNCGNGSCIDGICYCHKGFILFDSTCFCQNCTLGDCVEEHLCQKFLRMMAISSTELNLSFSSESSNSESTSESSTSESSTSISTTEQATNCNNSCWAGTCVDNVCQCPNGSILHENDCITLCEARCKNGFCTDDGQCKCHPGYVLKFESKCDPQCDKECVNSFCIAPNQCECNEGYIAQLNPLSAHICLPTCDGVDGEEGCLNGTCVAVNKCQCIEGFVHKPGNRFECEPMPMAEAENRHGSPWYFYLIYVVLGLLILLIVAALGLVALGKMYQDSYNVGKVEKHRATVRYTHDDHQYCVI